MTSLPARAYGVIRRPRATFAAILGGSDHDPATRPHWAPVLAATTVITFICTFGLLRTEVGRQALVDQWERTALAFGQDVDDQRYAGMEAAAASAAFVSAYAAVTTLLNGPVLAFVLSGVLFLVLNQTTRRRGADPAAARTPFSKVLVVVCYAAVILALRQLVATPIDYVRESIASPTTLMQFFSMLDEASPLARFLGVIDLFVIWWIVVLAIGMSILYGRPTRRLALTFAGAYVALALLAALAMAVSGGTI